jgi:phosphoglycolate phosphatase
VTVYATPSTHNENTIEAVLFDLDGTLIDHFTTIHRSINYAFNELGVPEVSYERVRQTVGGSISITIRRLMGENQADEAVALFRTQFDKIWREDLKVLPGAEWLLKELRSMGLKTVIFTNKEGPRARRITEYLGWNHLVDGVIGTLDTPWKKPEPEFTRHVLKQLRAEPNHACLIGDSPFDLASAVCVNMPAYLVATGSHSIEELEQTNCQGSYSDLYELAELLFELKHTRTHA